MSEGNPALQAPDLTPDPNLMPEVVEDTTPDSIVSQHTGKTITQPSPSILQENDE